MKKSINKYTKGDLQRFIEGLEETVLRLHTWFRGTEEKYDQFKWAKKFCKGQGIKVKLSRFKEEEMKQFLEYLYYRGKLYAYLYVLGGLGSDVPNVIERLRGLIMIDDNTMMETKAHYTERKGHFDTDEFKLFKEKHKI